MVSGICNRPTVGLRGRISNEKTLDADFMNWFLSGHFIRFCFEELICIYAIGTFQTTEVYISHQCLK
jgi:hypothetical protein